MDEGFTQEQKAQIKTWAEQRDEFLLEISNLRVAKEGLQIDNKALAEANTDIEKRMNVILGRIKELSLKESGLPFIISKEIAALQSQKTTLESEVILINKIIEALTPQKISLEADISFALNTLEIIKGEALLLDKVVDRVTVISKENTDKIDLLVSNLATSLEEIIDVNRKNVFETNIVIEKLPVMLMEAQKHGLIKPRQAIIKN